jgi:predicted amidohydrolase YtcJ
MLNFFLWVMAMNISYTSCALELTGFINAQIFDGEKILQEDAFLIQNKKFVLIDKSEKIQTLTKNIINLEHQFVMPGFIESHAHLVSLGRSLSILNLKNKSLQQILDLISEETKKAPPNSWIIGRGWDQNLWADKKFPTASMLDSVSKNHKVCLIRTDGHAYWVNTQALKAGMITKQTKAPFGGQINNGILLDNAMQLISPLITSKAHKKNYLELALKKALSVGITSFHDASSDQDTIDLLITMATNNSLKPRVYAMLDGSDEKLVNNYLAKGPQDINNFLAIRSIKYFADGALGSRGALLLQDYADDKGNKGLLLITKSDLVNKTKLAIKHNFQIATHAIGDAANKLVLDAYEEAQNKVFNKRLRIEHAQIIDPSDQKRFSTLNIIASMQPIHYLSDISWVPARIGEKDLDKKAYPWASLLKHNTKLAFGSDAPVEDLNPLLGLHTAVSRPDIQQLSMKQALKAYYEDAAYSEFNEHQKGKIALNFLADFIVFRENIFKLTKTEFLNTKVLKTFIGGSEAFSL